MLGKFKVWVVSGRYFEEKESMLSNYKLKQQGQGRMQARVREDMGCGGIKGTHALSSNMEDVDKFGCERTWALS